MKKDIKIGIIGLVISMSMFFAGMVAITNARVATLIAECSSIIKIVFAILSSLFFIAGFMGTLSFIVVTIAIICVEYHNKKVDRYNSTLKQKIESELPKGIEFDINIVNQNNDNLNKLLYENLKCTAVFDGETVDIRILLPEEVSIKTDVLWFYDNFQY